MITDFPLAAAGERDGLLDKISAFVREARDTAADGLTWSEFGELMLALLRLVVSVLDAVSNLTGEQKKALTLQAVADLFDAVADRAVPPLAYPLWVLARPAVRALVLALASGAVEQVLPLVRG